MTGHPRILVVGTGSAGQRHARNLAALGCRISGFDPRPDRRQELITEVPEARAHATLEEGLVAEGLAGVVVASPPRFHVEQALAALDLGLPVLLEKPVAPELGSARELAQRVEQTGGSLLLGYTWRWWQPLSAVRTLLEDGAIGRLLHVRCSLSAHLADWHPWERYQDFFMSSRELGGGALLDESHWIDLMLWLFGMPDRVFARIDKLSSLEIDTDDNVDMVLDFPNGLRALLHLDLFGRPHERIIRFVGEKGTIEWSDAPNAYRMSTSPVGEWRQESFDQERNDMFVAVAEEFLRIISGQDRLTCSIQDGVRVMRIIEAARRSEAEGQVVELSGGAR